VTKPEEARSATLRRIQRRRKLASIRKTIIACAFVVAALVTYCTVGRLPYPVSKLAELAGARDSAETEDVAAATEPVASDEPARPPPPAIDVDDSDPLVRQLAKAISSDPRLVTWLVSDDLIRRFTASVANIAEGVSPRKQLEFLTPATPFRVVEGRKSVAGVESVSGVEVVEGEESDGDDGRVWLDPQGGERYDAVAEAFASLQVDTVAAVYRRLRPLLFRAYADLGYPDASFDDALQLAIEEIWHTPIREGDIELIPAGAGYQYADPELESMSGAQKQFFRMGPRNRRLVRRQLAAIAPRLGLAELPPIAIPADRPPASSRVPEEAPESTQSGD
jgi:hypothetical protein